MPGPKHSPARRYRGRLTPERVAEGINAARRNVQRLVVDAALMVRSERWPSAVALSTLAIEEAGKIPILLGLAMAETEQEAQSTWKQFRSHVHKNAAWIFPELQAQGAKNLDDFAGILHPDSTHTRQLDTLKQLALYVDCYGEGEWSGPEDLGLEGLAKDLLAVAGRFSLSQQGNCTVREIELWIEHVGPVRMSEPSRWKAGILRWRRALQDEGLAEGDIVGWSSFLGP